MEKILISACFLAQKVRYDGKIKQIPHPIIESWRNQNRLVTVCPEVAGGLAIPRPPAEYHPLLGRVITISGEDVNDAFNLGASTALALCKKFQIKYALLKESSPSCGSTNIYDGSFSSKKINGEGITTKLLRTNNIQVFSEENIQALIEIIAGEQTNQDRVKQ